jgi:glutaredoxin
VTLARFVLLLTLAAAAFAAAGQRVYRWTDEQGRTHVTDTPPPAGARGVRQINPGAAGGAPSKSEAQVPYSVDVANKQYPVTLYTSPGCGEGCTLARALLNKRGVPFKEVQVWEEESNAELKRVSGGNQVPALKVGSSVYTGFLQTAYDGLLDSAGYPRAGILPQRTQAAPGRPEGYEEREVPKAVPVKPEPPQPPAGPYAPRGG